MQRSGVIFHAYASAHNKLESVGPTLESKMAPSKEGEHGRKRDNSGRKKAQDDERKSCSNQRKRMYLVNNIFEAWENSKIETGCKRCSDSDFAAICCL